MTTAPRIGIVSISGDLHLRAVVRAIARQRCDALVYVFDVASLATHPGCFSITDSQVHATLMDERGAHVDLSTLDAIWWRRHSLTFAASASEDASHLQLIQRDTQTFIEGAFLSSFRGAWVNHPVSAKNAENKLVQLAAAAQLGIRIPETTFTNDRSVVQRLQQRADGTVVKCISGVPSISLTTQLLTAELVADSSSIAASPACYQQLISGDRHLRILIAGDHCEAALSLSSQIDSRIDERAQYSSYEVPKEVASQLKKLLSHLGLSMGVVDMKIDDCGHFYFLELNQQGQILATDVQAGTSMCEVVSSHLLEVATRNLTLRSSGPSSAAAEL